MAARIIQRGTSARPARRAAVVAAACHDLGLAILPPTGRQGYTRHPTGGREQAGQTCAGGRTGSCCGTPSTWTRRSPSRAGKATRSGTSTWRPVGQLGLAHPRREVAVMQTDPLGCPQRTAAERTMDSPLGAHVARVVDRADGQVALEPPKRLFDLGELDVADPQLDRILAWRLGAWPIATLAAARLAQLLATRGEGEGVGPDAQAGLGPMQLTKPIRARGAAGVAAPAKYPMIRRCYFQGRRLT